MSILWLRLVAYVANAANESGFFVPSAGDWLLWSGYTSTASQEFADLFGRAGGLKRYDGRWYVTGWHDTYRLPVLS